MITRFYREDFIQNVSSLEGLKILLSSGTHIYSLKGLHTKLYHIDGNFSIVTSANYTLGGLYSNIELGIKIENEMDINNSCEAYFDDLWEQIDEYNIENSNSATVTLKQIEEEIVIVNKSSSYRTKSTTNFNNTKQGAELKRKTNVDLIETAIQEKVKGNLLSNSGAWLKFEADAQHRHDPDLSYIKGTNKYTRNKTFFPTNPVGVKSTDRLFLALVSYDKDYIATPMIIGRSFTSGFKRSFKVDKNFKGWEDWMENYPYYVEPNNIELIKGPAKLGISLLDIYRKLKGKIYPSTFEKEISFEKIRQYHYQKDKIRITEFAEEYLNEESDKLFNIYGKEDVWNYKES